MSLSQDKSFLFCFSFSSSLLFVSIPWHGTGTSEINSKILTAVKKRERTKLLTPPRRGIEPRSPAWQAGILTTILTRNELKQGCFKSLIYILPSSVYKGEVLGWDVVLLSTKICWPNTMHVLDDNWESPEGRKRAGVTETQNSKAAETWILPVLGLSQT